MSKKCRNSQEKAAATILSPSRTNYLLLIGYAVEDSLRVPFGVGVFFCLKQAIDYFDRALLENNPWDVGPDKVVGICEGIVGKCEVLFDVFRGEAVSSELTLLCGFRNRHFTKHFNQISHCFFQV